MQLKRIGPSWYRGVRRHGLIMGCSVTATKPAAGSSPLPLGPKAEVSQASNTNPLSFLARVLLGSLAGFYYFVLPVYMWCVPVVVVGAVFKWLGGLVSALPCLPTYGACLLQLLVRVVSAFVSPFYM